MEQELPSINKNISKLSKISKEDSDYIDAVPQDRISYIWEVTKSAWSFKEKNFNAEQRLQRNASNIIKK